MKRGGGRVREKKECMDFINAVNYGERKEEICRLRTVYCLEWYTRKAIQYKAVFIVLSIVNIAIPQISTILLMKNEYPVAGAVMSAAVSVSASVLALLNVKDRWTSYRSAAEFIKAQYGLYCLKAPPYHGEDPHTVYLCTIEQYMTKEHGNWVKMQNKTTEESEK